MKQLCRFPPLAIQTASKFTDYQMHGFRGFRKGKCTLCHKQVCENQDFLQQFSFDGKKSLDQVLEEERHKAELWASRTDHMVCKSCLDKFRKRGIIHGYQKKD